MRMRWAYKRRYGAKFRKAIFGATVEFPKFKSIKLTVARKISQLW